jgi:hypothetical protein
MYNLEVQRDHTFVVGVGQWVVHNECSRPVNSKGEPYPQMIDPRTGQEVPFPGGDLHGSLPNSWGEYDIHHILPREFGGTNDFWNLVPLERDFHNKIVTPWWNAFGI